MLDSLYIGATGMQAQQLNIDTIANNLANVNTSGYKRSRIDFEDLLYRNVSAAATGGGMPAAANGRMGMGAAISGTSKVFTEGDIKQTGEQLDVAINGAGFFEVTLPGGGVAYTRSGALQLDRDGMLITQSGQPLAANIQVPPDARQVRIDADGRVYAVMTGDDKGIEIGQIEIVTFTNPAGLSAVGQNLFTTTDRSGDAHINHPGEGGSGVIAQGYLESSNVRLIDEMVALIVAQRAYEINSKVVQASDEMLSIGNGLYK